jgi:hypothetical protein
MKYRAMRELPFCQLGGPRQPLLHGSSNDEVDAQGYDKEGKDNSLPLTPESCNRIHRRKSQ